MKKIINLIVILISVATILSGLTQLIKPDLVLGFIANDAHDMASYFFSIVGMFMTLFGGLMLHAIYSPHPQKPAILWCALQKLCAFIAVSMGIINGHFSMLASGVAVFDLFSGLLFLYYLKKMA